MTPLRTERRCREPPGGSPFTAAPRDAAATTTKSALNTRFLMRIRYVLETRRRIGIVMKAL
jgi:hypothetical protein